jgi:Sec-independent protein secretion pathway component TatC
MDAITDPIINHPTSIFLIRLGYMVVYFVLFPNTIFTLQHVSSQDEINLDAYSELGKKKKMEG